MNFIQRFPWFMLLHFNYTSDRAFVLQPRGKTNIFWSLKFPVSSSATRLCSHRSQSVVRIYATVRFEPSKINIFVKDCQRGGKDVTCMSAIVCFNITARTAISPTQEIGKPAKIIPLQIFPGFSRVLPSGIVISWDESNRISKTEQITYCAN